MGLSIGTSQQQRHDYLGARLGLARFRTLTLPPEVTHVEAYRRLGLADFTTRSPAALVAELGGHPPRLEVREGPTMSVIVRTKDRPELLAQALASLAATTYRRAEAVVVNDGGARPAIPADFPLPLRVVDLENNRGRAAAANAGFAAAAGDYVVFLDDDDLAFPEHLETLDRGERSRLRRRGAGRARHLEYTLRLQGVYRGRSGTGIPIGSH